MSGSTNVTITGGKSYDYSTTNYGGLGGPTLNVTYGSGGGTLIIGQSNFTPTFPLLPLGGINFTGFGGSGDIIDDKAISYSHLASYTLTGISLGPISAELITFTSSTGAVIGTFTFRGTPVPGYSFPGTTYNVGMGPLHITSDGSGGIDVQACLVAGTAIATPEGERLVESIAAGDLVITASGESRAVTWVGHRTVERGSRADADIHDPVVIAAGAIAPGIPARDLRVTADHAILIEDRLIPARLLVNGTTIRQEPIATYTYFHVELDHHDILLAEGLTVESYLDCGDRGRFANADVVALYARPAAQIDAVAVYAAHGYRPLTLDADTVRPIWQALADRAAALGAAPSAPMTTDDAGLHLMVDGRRVAPVAVDGRRVVFALPPGAASVAIVSRAARPSQVSPWLDDRRRLGVQVARAVVRDGIAAIDIAMDGPAARAGWHAIERGASRLARWTDGRGELALPPVAGPATLELTIAPMAAYPAADLAIAA